MDIPLRGLLKRVFYRALRLGGEDARRLRRAGQQGLVTVLCLHRVSPHPNPYYAPLLPAHFDDLLAFLTRSCRVTTFDELEASPPRPDGRPAVVLSFDDGYLDFVQYALPILEKYRVSANQNVIVGCVEGGRPPWTIELADFLQAAPPSLLRELRVPGFAAPPPDGDDGRARYGARLSHHLKMRPAAERAPLFEPVRRLMDRLGPFALTPMMSLDDVKAIASTHHVGAHSYSHESMGHESDAYFADDLARCQRFFSDQLRLPLRTYAFPNGSFRPSQIDALTQAGVGRVLLVEEKLSRQRGPVYPRVSIAASSRSEARLQAAGFRSAGVS